MGVANSVWNLVRRNEILGGVLLAVFTAFCYFRSRNSHGGRQFWALVLGAFALLAAPTPLYAQEAICAEVKIEIKQKVSLERQAFDAVLKINNGLTDQSIDNLQVTVTFADAAGNSVVASSDPSNIAATFFIRVDKLTGVNAIDGSGAVAAKSTAEVRWIIIPSAGAGGIQPSGKLYNVGASISYKLGSVTQSVAVTPEAITVRPQPLLALDYFLQQDIYADDPFTPAVEPSEPATLGVRIRNIGGGVANAMKIDTAQPKIVENRQGLLIGFQIINGFVNDIATGKTLLLDFGAIQPGKSAVGRWDLTTTLAGRFTEFSAEYSHSDSLGGALTSLIDSVTTRFLIKDVKVDLPGRDNVRDFLSADGGLKVYESDGVDTPVINVSANALLANSSGVYRLTHQSSNVLTYAKVADPNNGTVALTTVTRSDGKLLDPSNFWLSKARNADLSWSYSINVFDSNSTGSYTLGLTGGTTATLAGAVYDDQNKNGVRDAGEPGIGTTRVDLTGNETVTGASVSAVAYADPSGAYSFAALKPGSYSLSVGATAARIDGTAVSGTAGGSITAATGTAPALITNIALAAGVNATGYLFAKIAPSTQPPAQADLGVSVTPVTVIMDDQATTALTYTVRNIGPNIARDVVVILTPSNTLRVNSGSSSVGAFDAPGKRWVVGDLAKDSSATLNVVIKANGSGGASVVATVSGSTQDPVSSNNSATTTFSVASIAPKADIKLSAFTPSLTVAAGIQTSLVFSAQNLGPDSAQNVVIGLSLPAQFVVANIIPIGGSGATFDVGSQRWSLSSLANATVAHLIVEGAFAANAAAPGNALFSAVLNSSVSDDNNVGNNAASLTLNATGRQADLRVGLSGATGSALTLTSADQGTVVLTLTNTGTEALVAADGVKLVFDVPANLAVVSASADRGSFDAATRVLSLTSLAAGESVTVTVALKPLIANTALVLTASANASVFDPDLSNNAASVTVNGGVIEAELQLTQTIDKPVVQLGDDVVFTVQLLNKGGATATGINVRDRLPPGLTFVSAATTPTIGAGSYDATTGLWSLPSLTKDATAVLALRATVSAAGSSTNTALVVAAQPDQDKANNAASATVTTNAAPTISINSPTPNTVVTAPGVLTLSASASDPDGNIVKVEFFNGTTLIGPGTLNAGGYTFLWNAIPSGTYSLTARATDNVGAVTTSASVNVIVNAAPTVSIALPTAGTTFMAPAVITLSAIATDSDGTISTVEFFNGATSIGLASLSGGAYALNWSAVPSGSYSVTAKATDNRGAVTISAAIVVVVNTPPNQAPTVSIVSPSNNSVIVAPGSFALTATAADVDGSVSKVEFFSDTTLIGIGTLSSGNYVFDWVNVPAGTYNITAKATDDKGATATSQPITLIVNALPSVSLTAPANNSTFTAPATMGLTATASDSDGTVSKVEFFNGTTLIGVATLANGVYGFSWTNVAAGSYSVTAKATDNRGATTTSSAATVTVNAVANQAPTVSLTAPANNAVANAPGTFALTAIAADSDGSIAKVEFFNGTALLGAATLVSGNYVYNWTNVAAGTYSNITAKATDDKGASATSSAIALIVNALPSVSLTAPANNSTFTAPATIGLTATASDSDGTVSKVEFFNGTTLIGVATLANGVYGFSWTNIAAGSYSVTAKATDNRGASMSSSTVSITVNAVNNQPPTVAWNSPATNSTISAPGSVALTATASDADGVVTKVEFFDGTTLIGAGSLTSGKYTYNWSGIAAGTYSNLTVRATDDKGATATSAAITLIVNALPSVSLTAPANNSTFTAPATIGLSATATDSDGTVSKVEFFNGATLIGAATLANGVYGYSWTNVAAGSYSVTAKATDNRGGTTTSSAATVTVNAIANQAPTVSITAPANNAVVNAPGAFALTATAADSDGSIAKVEFFNGTALLGAATLVSGNYVYNWTNVAAGTYSNITARATDDKAATATSSAITLIVNALPSVSLTAPANNSTFTAPATIGLTATASDSDGTVSKVEFFNGVTLIGAATLANGVYGFSWTNIAAGSYSVTAKATDNRGATAVSAARALTVTGIVANLPPTVTFTAPVNNTVVSAPGSVILTASASDTDGSVAKVEFFNGSTLIGTGALAAGAYSYSWTNIAAGTYANITAKATDDKGATATTPPLAIIVNALPTVGLTSPATNASFNAPATILLSATASDSDGTVSKVEFYNGSTLLGIGTLTNSVYNFSWSAVPAGSYSIAAKATDDRGGTTTTPARAISVVSCGTVASFSFASLDNVDLNVALVSNPVTITGINCLTAISVVGGEYNVNAGGFTSVAATVKAGDVVRLRVTSSSDYQQTRSAVLTVGSALSNFAVTTVAKPIITQTQLKENRVLVYVACGSTDSTDAQCLTKRKQFVTNYLDGLAIESFVTSDATEFQSEMRCGKYNTYWVSGGFDALKGSIDDELAEAIYRGDGLLVDGVQDARSARIDEVSKVTYGGTLPTSGLTVFNTGSALTTGSYPTIGKAAKMALSGAQLQASFESANTTASAKPAVVSAGYGAGKSMTYGFDWVASAQASTATTLLKDSLLKGLILVKPNTSDDQTPGALVKLRTTVTNPAQATSSVEVATTLPADASFVASSPLQTSAIGNTVKWRVNLSGQSSTNIDWSMRAPTTDSVTAITSTLSRVTPTGTVAVPAISTVATPLIVGSYSTRTGALRSQLVALALVAIAEKTARDAAVASLDTALGKRTAGKYSLAVSALLAASASLDKITTVPTDLLQLQASQLLKALSREACANGINPSACSATAMFTNVSDFDNDGNDGGNVKVVRVRGGGSGSATSGFGSGTWQVGSLLKTSNIQSQSTSGFSYIAGRSYNWTFEYKGNGKVSMTLADGSAQTVTVSTGSGWSLINAIKFRVHADAGIGAGTIIENNVLTLNGQALTGGLIATSGNNTLSDISKVLSGPALTAPFKVTGTVKLQFVGAVPPNGDKLLFEITGGEGECNV